MIRVENLGFTYPGAATPILEDVSFSIEKGEIYGLLGPSGAGKSTTQKILMGQLLQQSGTVQLFDQPLAALGRGLYQRIGVSFELPALYLRLTARENLQFFASLYEGPVRDIDDTLALVDLADAADQRVDTFSKGMKMRLNLCRALLHDPELLFLDEPTTGQDPARARTTRQLMLKLKAEGKTILLTTHNMAEADEVCDRVGFLIGGRIPETGAPQHLKSAHGDRTLEVLANNKDRQERHIFQMQEIGSNKDFLALLATGTISAMHTHEASLDDIFIKLANGDGGK